jgi:hypothetical protein
MTEVSDLLLDNMIVDCASISISYAANGLASVTFTAFTPKEAGPPYDPDGPGFNLCIGGVTFDGWINDMSLNASSDLADYLEWRVTAVAVGCRKEPCSQGC